MPVDPKGAPGFTPRVCAAYRPQTKGKVESGVGYVKKNFVCSQRGRPLSDLGQLRAGLQHWVWEVANQRVHGTTQRHVLTAWQEEKRLLLPLAGRAAYPFIGEERRKVSRDAFVSYRGNRYSVPWPVAGQEVLLHEEGEKMVVQRGGERLAVHPLWTSGARQTITVAAHHEGIPLGLANSTGQAKLLLQIGGAALPEVEVRPLWAYEQYSQTQAPAQDLKALLDGLELDGLEVRHE